MDEPAYRHTQRGRIYWIPMLVGLALVTVALCILGKGILQEIQLKPGAWVSFGVLLGIGTLLMLVGLCFVNLTVVGYDDRLQLTYGVVPLFRATFSYEDVEEASIDRTRLIDGWGIHWVPGRGWTYNLWGFRCVRLVLRGSSIVRIGSDDVDNLHEFIVERVRRTREHRRESVTHA